MSRFILITILVLTDTCLLQADYDLLAMNCDDSTTVKKFNLCTEDRSGIILCRISSDTYGSNHGFKMLKNGNEGDSQNLLNYLSYDKNSSIKNIFSEIDADEPQSVRYQCVRYNSSEDGSGTVDKVCGATLINFHTCAWTHTIVLLMQEAEDATLHCSDAPEDSQIQWYFKSDHNRGSIKFLGTSYTINIRNLTGDSTGDYRCIAVNHGISTTVAYAHKIKLKVKEHFRSAFTSVKKRGAESVKIKCYPLGVTSVLYHVNISKWTLQYTSLGAGQYNKWSTAESANDTVTLAGLTPSTWYLMKGQVTDSTGKTVQMRGNFFSTDAASDHSTTMDILSGSGGDDMSNNTYEGGIRYPEMKSVLVMAGDNVIMECGFNMDHLTAHFDFEATWTRNLQEPVPKENSKYARQNHSLVINSFSSRDVDTYVCQLKATPKDGNAGFTAVHMVYAVKVKISGSVNRIRPSAPVRVISPPVEVQCVSSASTTIIVGWSDNPRNTDSKGFKVQYWKRMYGDATAEKKEVFIPKNAQGNRNEFTGLQPRSSYAFKVSAVDSDGYKGGAAMKTCVTL